MDTRKRKRDEHESDTTVAYLRRGAITVLDALDEQLPDVFAADILPKLSLKDTLNLAQVSKAYRDSVWSVRGVQSLEAKIKAHGKKFKAHVHFREEPMYYATKYLNLPAIRALLQSGVEVDQPISDYQIKARPNGLGPVVGDFGHDYSLAEDVTALWFASKHGHAAVVKELIEAGADVNVRASANNKISGKILSDVTPLHVATENGHTPVVVELIRAGADVNVPNSNGATPLYMAALYASEGCALALLQAGADVNKAPTGCVTPLSAAIGHVNKAPTGCVTPLSITIERKYEKVVKLLKHFGAR